MQLHLLAIGQLKSGAERDLFASYQKRLRWPLSLYEMDVKKRLPDAIRQEEESRLLLEKCPLDAVKIVLDERGKSLTSQAFADQLQAWQNQGRSQIALMIGGADGHSPILRQSADLLLSFGAMTWPHKLCRIMLMEQLYRAESILAGHPYHRG